MSAARTSAAPGLVAQGIATLRALAAAAIVCASIAAPAIAAPPRVAVLIADTALAALVEEGLQDAGVTLVSRPAAERVSGIDLASGAAAARRLAHEGICEAVVLGEARTLRQQAAPTGASANVQARLVVVSGASGEALIDAVREARGGAADPARALAKARQEATRAALAELTRTLAQRLAEPQRLALAIEVEALSGEAFDLHEATLARVLARAGFTRTAERHDTMKRLLRLEVTHPKASQDEAERLLRRALRDEGLADALTLGALTPGQVRFVYQDPFRSVPISVSGVDEGSQRATGADLATAFAALPAVRKIERAYDAATETLTLHAEVRGPLAALDAKIAQLGREAGPLGALELTDLGRERLGYRLVRAVETRVVELIGVEPERTSEVAVRLDDLIAGIPGVLELERSEDASLGHLRYRIRFQGRTHELERVLLSSLRGEGGFPKVTPVVPGTGADLGYRIAVSLAQTYRVRIHGLVPAVHQKVGQPLVEVIAAIPGVKVRDRRYDAAEERLELAIEAPSAAFDLDRRVWQAARSIPDLARIGPGETRGSDIGYRILPETPTGYQLAILVGRLSPEAYAGDGRKLIDLVRGLDGASEVKPSFTQDRRELTIALRYATPSFELEERLWSALEESGLAERFAADKRGDQTVRLSHVERLGDGWKVFVRIEGADAEPARAAAARLVERLVSIDGLSAIETRLADPTRLEVEMGSQRTPVAVYDDVASLVGGDPQLSSLVDRGLEGNVIALMARAPVAAVAAPPAGPSTATPPPSAPTTPGTTAPGTTAPGTTAPGTTAVPPAAPTAPPTASAAQAIGAGAGDRRLADLVAQLDPTVVSITASLADGGSWMGSGFIISPRGYVLTNEHVAGAPEGVPQGAVRLSVKLADGREVEARYIDGKRDLDIALLKLPGGGYPAAVMGDSDRLRPGDGVIVIGNPLGLEHSVTTGIVSGLDRERGRIQTNALINPGNSGGPAFDDAGRVVGLAVAGRVQQYQMREGAIRVPYPGLNFLVPINQAFEYLEIGGATRPR